MKVYRVCFEGMPSTVIRAEDSDEARWQALQLADEENVIVSTVTEIQTNRKHRNKPINRQLSAR